MHRKHMVLLSVECAMKNLSIPVWRPNAEERLKMLGKTINLSVKGVAKLVEGFDNKLPFACLKVSKKGSKIIS